MIRTLSLDLETRSSVDLAKCGVYRYCESTDFDILLFGVSVDSGPVTVYDLACGETVPEEILAALSDERVTKWAYNAAFERVCLSVWLRRNYPEHFRSYSIPGDPTIPSTSGPTASPAIPCRTTLIRCHGNAHWSGQHTTVCRWGWRRSVLSSALKNRNLKKAKNWSSISVAPADRRRATVAGHGTCRITPLTSGRCSKNTMSAMCKWRCRFRPG